jgi:hypothetical protein
MCVCVCVCVDARVFSGTFPEHKDFDSDSSEQIQALRRVLTVYSWHNPTLGYCQGLNMLAAFGLLFLSEEDTFWMLVDLIDFILPTVTSTLAHVPTCILPYIQLSTLAMSPRVFYPIALNPIAHVPVLPTTFLPAPNCNTSPSNTSS